MRRGTILALLALILAVAFFGLLKVFQVVIVLIVTLLVLFFGAIFLGAWLLKRRMNRKLAELQQAIQRGQQEAAERRKADQMRSEAIDVEPTAVRDDRR